MQTDFLHYDGMERNERLRLARARRYRTAKEAASAMGVPYGTYSGHEAGSRGFSETEARQYAATFRVRLPWLLLDDGPMEIGETRRHVRLSVPVLGYAAAGSDAVEFYGEDQGQIDEVEAPEGASKDTVAVRIRGTSMGRFLDGWLAFYDDRRDPPDESLSGQVCVCGLAGDHRVLIKKLRLSATRGLFHLESVTEPTMFDVEVKWAARIKSFRPD